MKDDMEAIKKTLVGLEGLPLLDFCFNNYIIAFKSGFGDYFVLCNSFSMEVSEKTAQKIYKVQEDYYKDMKAQNWAKGQFGNAGDD